MATFASSDIVFFPFVVMLIESTDEALAPKKRFSA
jgi:hypothetical protein